jgi:pimeloyl-ACP methyl ester carboxylesterase
VVQPEREFRVPTEGGDLVGWLREGAPAVPPALLLHGGPGLSEYLKPLADELDGLFAIARYQQRGIWPSVATGERDVMRHVDDAVAVLDGLGWERAIVIGHSWGGHLAMHFAVAHPERLAGFVAVDPLGGVGDGGMTEFVGTLSAQLSAEDRLRHEELDHLESPTAAQREEAFSMVWPYYFANPSAAPPFPEFSFDMESDRTWQSIEQHFAEKKLEHGLTQVNVPFLLIHGEASPLPIAEARRTVEIAPNGRLVPVANSGHWPWLERPGVVRDSIREFLADLG